MTKLEKKNEREFLDETAYTFFEMSEREIELRADTKNNKIIKEAYNKKVEKYTKVLYAQARLIEGLPIENPTEISNLVCEILSK